MDTVITKDHQLIPLPRRDVVNLFRYSKDHAGMQVAVKKPYEVEFTVEIDPGLLRWIVRRAAGNKPRGRKGHKVQKSHDGALTVTIVGEPKLV